MTASASGGEGRSKADDEADDQPKPTRLTAEDRRTQILDVARQEFLRSGFAGARIREISRVAGVNEALLYRHFDSKDELFEAAIVQPFEESVEGLMSYRVDAVSYAQTPELRRKRVAELLSALLTASQQLVPLLGALLFADPERGQAFYRSHFHPTIERFSEAIEGMSDSWDHRDFDPRVVVLSGIAACVALVLERGFAMDSTERERLAGELADNILYGLEARAVDAPAE